MPESFADFILWFWGWPELLLAGFAMFAVGMVIAAISVIYDKLTDDMKE